MFIKFIENTGVHRKGDRLDVADKVARQWIDAGLAIEIKLYALPDRDKALKSQDVNNKRAKGRACQTN